MREIGEQWVEEIDGVRHMVKAVKGVEGEKLCTACIFKPRIYPDYSKIRHDTVQTPFRCAYGVLCPIEEGYIKDLGPVNKEGLLPCPFCGEFPTIKEELDENDVCIYSVEHECEAVVITTGWSHDKQEVKDAWNRRA